MNQKSKFTYEIKEVIHVQGGRRIDIGDCFYNIDLGGEIREYTFEGFVKKTKVTTCIFSVRKLTKRYGNYNQIMCEYPHPDTVNEKERNQYKNFEWLERNLNTFDYQRAVELSKQMILTQNSFF